jgi:hypothetical protein
LFDGVSNVYNDLHNSSIQLLITAETITSYYLCSFSEL